MTESNHIFERYVAGDSLAADELFYRYVERLTRLARSRLSASLAQRIDAEDIVMSAYRSFFVGARDGEFTIEASGDLWPLLVRITLNKLYRTAAHHDAQKRAMTAQTAITDSIAANEPSPDQAAALADEVQTLMRGLAADRRRILELRLQGELFEDIATHLGVTERTVRRAMKEIRAQLVRQANLSDDGLPATVARRAASRTERTAKLNATLSYSDFVLHEQIGIGGMGRVYRATRKHDNATVAIKYLRKSFIRRPVAVERFIREATIVAKLYHPGIVGVHGFGQTPGGGLFIAMDYVAGHDLTRWCDEPRSHAEIVNALAQVCDALEHVHAAGVIHCDLKPGNILVREDKQVLLTDFGLAVESHEGIHSGLAGTAPYMAPEQIDASLGSIDARTDVYGLGAVLFHLCTRRLPYVGDRLGDILSAVVVGCDPPVPSAIRPEAALFDEICARCLGPHADRFPSAALVRVALTESVLS